MYIYFLLLLKMFPKIIEGMIKKEKLFVQTKRSDDLMIVFFCKINFSGLKGGSREIRDDSGSSFR